jgi:hypothetical protein
MAKIRGKLSFADLGGGVWRLEADDGERYDLDGLEPSRGLQDGARVEISGDVRDDMAGIGMGGGPMLVVKSCKKI